MVVDSVSRPIARSMASALLDESHEEVEDDLQPTPVSPLRDILPPKVPGVSLPPLSSGDWEEAALPSPPPSTCRPRTRSTTRGGRYSNRKPLRSTYCDLPSSSNRTTPAAETSLHDPETKISVSPCPLWLNLYVQSPKGIRLHSWHRRTTSMYTID